MKHEKKRSTSDIPAIIMKDEGGFLVDEFGAETKICDWIRHVGNGLRADNSGAADIIAFHDRSGRSGEVMIAHMDLVNDSKKLFAGLADHNYSVPTSKAHR